MPARRRRHRLRGRSPGTECRLGPPPLALASPERLPASGGPESSRRMQVTRHYLQRGPSGSRLSNHWALCPLTSPGPGPWGTLSRVPLAPSNPSFYADPEGGATGPPCLVWIVPGTPPVWPLALWCWDMRRKAPRNERPQRRSAAPGSAGGVGVYRGEWSPSGDFLFPFPPGPFFLTAAFPPRRSQAAPSPVPESFGVSTVVWGRRLVWASCGKLPGAPPRLRVPGN